MAGALVAKREFVGIENVAHLAAGGEAPVLHGCIAAVNRFVSDKGSGQPGRARMFDTAAQTRTRLAALLGVTADEIALLWNASAGMHALAANVDLRAGDNIVTPANEFISLLTVWPAADVELRQAGTTRQVTLGDVAQAVDSRTRAIVISHVSYLTGARSDLAALREIADRHGARLIVDASHSLGAVAVDGSLCDAVVACCYKWMLGTHGVGVFYVNARRWPDVAPSAIGWNSLVAEEDRRWQSPADLKPGLDRFEAGNPSFMSVYFLESALARLERAGANDIEQHILDLGGELRAGLARLKVDLLTPENPERRAGNICFATDRFAELEEQLRSRGVLTWADEGRVRISVHAYNDAADVARALAELERAV
jgi:cysteine desulfurase / selenocysteine lyase